MAVNLKQVFLYLDTHPLTNWQGEFESVLKMLFSVYSETNMIETEEIRKYYASVDEILQKLPIKENDRIFDLTVALCQEYEQSAFYHGICVGMRLLEEIQTLVS